jgi:hypothetical protein
LLAITPACSQAPATTEEQPVSQRPAEFAVGPITFEPSTVMVNDSVIATATVKNIGDIVGIYTAIFTIDGQEIDKKDITIEPGNNKEASFKFSKTVSGIYSLAIGDASATMTVHEWNPYKIQYSESDGSQMGIYVSGENGHMVHLTPPAKPFRVQTIRIFGIAKIKNTREFDEKHVTVKIWDKDGNNQLWSQDLPWRLFMGGTWVEVKVPGIRVNDDFQVEIVTHSDPAGGDPIDFADIIGMGLVPPSSISESGGVFVFGTKGGIPSIVLIGFDRPKSYTPSNRPETRSGYSYMGKPIDPGKGSLKGINWLIQVEGEGAVGN